jgi:Uma2 family endonuclease
VVAASTPRSSPSLPLTYADLARFPDDRNRYEIIDGSLHVTPSPMAEHQLCVAALLAVLRTAVPPDQVVLPAPMDVRLADDTVLQPDVLIVERASLAEGPVTSGLHLVIEIASPSTKSYDALLKRHVYARFGVPEYWVVEPAVPSILALRLDAGSGEYHEREYVQGRERYRDEQRGITLVPAELLDG